MNDLVWSETYRPTGRFKCFVFWIKGKVILLLGSKTGSIHTLFVGNRVFDRAWLLVLGLYIFYCFVCKRELFSIVFFHSALIERKTP